MASRETAGFSASAMYSSCTILCMCICLFFFFFDPEGLPYKFLVFAPEVDR